MVTTYCNTVVVHQIRCSNSTCCIEKTAAAVRLSVVNTSSWLTALMPFKSYFGKCVFFLQYCDMTPERRNIEAGQTAVAREHTHC
jgi:hypothetical protein